MIKLTETYVDYNGVERTEDFYFHFTKAELLKMEMGVKGGLAEMVKRAAQTQDAPTIIKVFEDLVAKSYGVKTPDGKGFDKDPKIVKEFLQTEAYSNIFMRLATDDEEAARFVNGVVPADMSKQAAAAIAEARANN